MAFLPALIGGGLGLIGSLISSNQNAHATQQASNAAQQGSQAETNLINQGLLPIYNQLSGDYSQFYQPYMPGFAGDLINPLLQGNTLPNTSTIDTLASLFPQLRDALTGVGMQGITNNILGYDSNPQDTLSGLGGVGGDALSTFLDPNTNLASLTPGAIAGLDPSMLASNFVGANAAEPFFLNEAQNGFSPQTIQSALNPMDAQVDQQINTMRNSLGSATPNIAGLESDMGLQGLQAKAGILSNLAGENQMFQNQGMQSAFGTANTMDQLTRQSILDQLGVGGGLDQQTMQRLTAALQGAGGIDQLTQNMLNNAYNVGNQQQGNGMNYLGQSVNTQQGLFTDLQNYLDSGRNMLPGLASGIQNVAQMYGNAAGQAGQNAMMLGMNQSNPFSALGSIFANNPNMFNFGGGGGSNSSMFGPGGAFSQVGTLGTLGG